MPEFVPQLDVVGSLGANGIGGGEVAYGPLSAIIDAFNDGDVAEYSVTYDGGTGDLTHQTGNPYEGSGHARMRTDNSNNWWTASNLENLPAPGDTFETYQYCHHGSLNGYIAAADDGTTDNAYRWFTNFGDGDVKIIASVGGSNTTLASTSVTDELDAYFRVEHGWATDGTLSGTWYTPAGAEKATISGVDTNLGQDGFGMGLGMNGSTSNLQSFDVDKAEIL